MEAIKIDMQQAVKLYSYEEYKELVKTLFEAGKVTGNTQKQEKLDATKINLTRIKRWDKTFKIPENLQQKLAAINQPMTWYLISEGWCGDSAQLLPLIAKMAESTKNVELKIILRDENPEIMDAYLTNGGKAIPKLIARDKKTDKDLFLWGPRPTNINKKVQEYKAKYTLDDHEEFVKNLHLWYARDKGVAITEDFIALL